MTLPFAPSPPSEDDTFAHLTAHIWDFAWAHGLYPYRRCRVCLQWEYETTLSSVYGTTVWKPVAPGIHDEAMVRMMTRTCTLDVDHNQPGLVWETYDRGPSTGD